MLIHRILAAIVLIPLVIITLFYASLSLFAYVMIAVCALAIWEWSQFLSLQKRSLKCIFVIIAVIVLSFLYFTPLASDVKNTLFATILMLSVLWWLVALILVIGYPTSANYWRNSMVIKLLFAFFTITPFFIGMLELRSIEYSSNEYTGAIWLLYIFVLVWATDSGAYFAGRAFGKIKLAPRVSPGKTVEGLIGGVLTAIIVSLAAYYFNIISVKFNVFFLSSLFAIFVSVLGDLTESMFKRESGIKDSGHLIPGHGGILDRIDSLTAAIPIFAVFALHLL